MIGENGRTQRRFLTSLGLLAAGLLAAAAGGFAATAADDKAKTDAVKSFQGGWVTTENEGIEAKWEFEGETVKTMVSGMDYVSKLKVDPAAKPHKTLDLAIEAGPEDSKGKISKGIYKLEGEKLTICISIPGKDRPKDFEQVEDECYLFQLKKEKK